ncbi:MAG: glycosyltransferase [Crocinitomicaceae bacterium]|nr:glycosyltransferase [Crocinitomicaceae bacterium]
MKNRLILVTSSFPYGTNETFLENEIGVLAHAFENVLILCPRTTSKEHRTIPDNCSVDFYDLTVTSKAKIVAVFGTFTRLFWSELKIIKKSYNKKISKGILSSLLISLSQGRRISSSIQKIMNEKGYESENTVLYSYWCDDTAIALGFLKKRNSELKSISRMHRWDIYFEESKFNYLPLRHFIYDNLNQLHSISDDGKKYAQEVWKIDPKKIAVSRLGVKKQVIIDKLDETLIVSCSNLIPVKRVDLIVDALASLENLSINWVHFGDGVELDKIRNKASENLQGKVSYDFKGRISNVELMEWYAENKPSALINVSSSEGVPVSIMEAMSFGIPVIATDVGGNCEIVNNENGILLEANPSVKKIKDAIESIVNDSSKKQEAYRTWKENYDAEKNYKNFVQLIQD